MSSIIILFDEAEARREIQRSLSLIEHEHQLSMLTYILDFLLPIHVSSNILNS